MKKVKIFKMVNTIILLLIISSSATLAKEIPQTTKKENLTETKQEKNNDKNSNISKSQEEAEEKIDNEKIDSEEYEVENFKIENIYQKGETTLVSYEHIKSGAKFVVWFEDLNTEATNSKSFKDPTMFFRYIPTNNLGIAHALEHFLAGPIKKKLENNFTIYELNEKILNHNPFATSDNFYDGVGFRFNITKWSPQVVKIVTDELKDPTFLKDNKEIFSREKKRMILELKGIEKYSYSRIGKKQTNSELYDRFIGGKFDIKGSLKDVEKLSFETAKKELEENIIPENILIQISARLNPDYKQIMKSFDERYLKNYDKKNSFKKDKQKLKTITETEPVRQIDVDDIVSIVYKKNFQKYDDQKFNNQAKLYWKIKNLSPKEKEIFNIVDNKNFINEKIGNEIKKLGYELITINDDKDIGSYDMFNSSQFDDLFYLNLYGNDLSKFEEKILKENAKKILNMLYEKIKNFDDNELLYLNRASDLYFSNRNDNYRNNYIFSDSINKSFALTNKPINEKFFDIEDNAIKDDYLNKRVLENLKKYKDNFKQIIDLPPTYIDIFTAKTTKKDEGSKPENETKLKHYQNPITFKSSNLILKEWAEKLTQDLFLLPNINDKGLCYNCNYFPYIESLNTEVKKIEEYVIGKFIKDFKKFKPTKEQFKKLNDNYNKSNLLEINELENKIKNLNESLKDPQILKKLAMLDRQFKLRQEFSFKFKLNELEEVLKNEKNKKNIKDTKEIIKIKKEDLKEISKNKDNINYYINKAKEGISNEIRFFKMRLKEARKKEDLRRKIKYEDFVNIFKNAEIKNSSHLEKYKPKKHENNLK